jgi:hypothetical protein
MVGGYSWSVSTVADLSTAKSGDTYCSGCTLNVSDVTITNSVAVSNATGEVWAAWHALQHW